MSEHECLVVRIPEIEPIPGADKIGLVRFGGNQVVVRREDWHVGDLAAYVEVDYIVPTDRPEFAFLADGRQGAQEARIRPRRLRGTWSMGLLVPAPTGHPEGSNALSALGVRKWEPQEDVREGIRTHQVPQDPTVPGWLKGLAKYDVENLRKYHNLLSGVVSVTEKIHGSNARYCFSSESGRLHVGSRSRWVLPDEACLWTSVLSERPWIADWCRENPDHVLFGEVFGHQDLKYGRSKPDFLTFDVRTPEGFWGPERLEDELQDFRRVPSLYMGRFDLEIILGMAEGKSVVCPDHVREGCVVQPVIPGFDPRIGRLILKAVGNGYLERA
jgi:RNA ligase (TIGR02306 family)